MSLGVGLADRAAATELAPPRPRGLLGRARRRLVVSRRRVAPPPPTPGRGRDPVALARPQLGDGLLGGQQLLVGRRELGDGRAPARPRPRRPAERGRDLRDGLVIGAVERRAALGQLGPSRSSARPLALRRPPERLEPALGANDGLARRLAARGRPREPPPRPPSSAPRPRGPPARPASCASRKASSAASAPRRPVAPRRAPRERPARAGGAMPVDEGSRARAERRRAAADARLEREPADLRLQLGDQVADAGEVVARLRQPDRGLVALDLEALDAGRLLEQLAALLRAQRERGVDRPLPHDDELVRAEPALAEELDDVAQTRPGAVDEVLALAGPIGAPADRDLGEVDRQPAVGVVEGQDRLGHALRLALLGAGEDDVVGAAGAERPVRLLAEHPADRIGHVALARPVRADDRVHARLEDEPGRVGEGLEAVEPELLQAAHAGSGSVRHRSVASAASAACSSARWRLDPEPVPRRWPPSVTTTWNAARAAARSCRRPGRPASCRGGAGSTPGAATSPTSGAPRSRPAPRAAAGRAAPSTRSVRSVPSLSDRAPGQRLEGGGQDGRSGGAAGLGLAAAEPEVSVEPDLERHARRARRG